MSKSYKNMINSIILNYMIIKLIYCQLNECPRERPIKKGDNCVSEFCSQTQFDSEDCIILNPIIKKQWLNDIILVGEKNFRYINILTSSKGELVFSTSSYPASRARIYYGIDLDGNAIFQDDSENDIYIIKKNVLRNEDQYTTIKRYESVSAFIKINGDTDRNKEYIIDLGKSSFYTEIFDYINYRNNLIEIPNSQTINAETDIYIGSLQNYIESEINYYFYAGLQRVYENDYKLLLIKFKFYYDFYRNVLCDNSKRKTFDSLDKKIAYCYFANNNIFMCLYISRNYKYKIVFLNTNLDLQSDRELSISYPSTLTTYYKFYHYKGDIWSLIYYQGITEDYPIIQFIEIKIIGSSYTINLKDSISLDNYSFNNERLLTDLIKIRDNLLCVIGTSKNKEVLIIILINFYNEEYNIRYYLIDIFKLYNHKFMKELKSEIYNNNIALGFSFCHQVACEDDKNDDHYTSLILFSYPNTTYYYFDMINYINKEENNDIIINLFDNVNIDNNIFGFIIDGLKIYSINNCDINLISNITNKPIKVDDIIRENERVELILTKNEYEISVCSLSYSLIITEPDFDEYNKYPNYILKENDENEKNSFSKYK